MKSKNSKRAGKLVRRMVILSVVNIILICVVIGIGIYQTKIKSLPKPQQLFEEYISYIQTKEYDKMYAMLEEQSKININEQEFITRNEKIYNGIDARNIKAVIQNINDKQKSQVVITYYMTLDTTAGEIEFSNQATYLKEKKVGYRLQWDHNLIFPNLEETDKVRITNLEAKRGNIVDRNDVLLAGQGVASSVGLVPGKMNKKPQKDIKKLAELLQMSTESIQKKLNATWVKPESFVPLKTVEKLDERELMLNVLSKEVIQKKQLQDNLLKIKGIAISDIPVRTYPLKEKTAHLIGYVQNITAEDLAKDTEKIYHGNSQIGKVGIESLYEDRLRGKNGGKISIVDKDGAEKQVLTSILVEDGETIKLTIDSQIQSLIYEQYKSDKSASVVLNPLSGEVLALVSTPTYNNNDFVLGLSSDKWNLLNEDKNEPLFNRFRATWSPGSSFKPVTGAIGITKNKFDANEDFGPSGRSWQKDESWGSYKVTTLQDYDNNILSNAFIYSDNIYFAKAALKIGRETFEDQLKQLGFKEKLPFDINMSRSTYSNEEKISSEVQLADSGYGQGQILINPLHLATIYSSFMNNGSMITPYLEYREKLKPTYWKEDVFSKDSVELIKNALIQVIEHPNGTGRGGKIQGLKMAGKTGTSEIKSSKEDTSGTELGWFATFTTELDRKNSFFLLTMVEDVKGRGGSGYVVKKNKLIIEKWGEILGIVNP